MLSINCIKKSLFEDVLFPINKLSEDAFTIPKLLLKSRRVVVNTVPLYFYVHRSGTITTSSYKKKDLDVIEAYFQNLKLVEEKCPKLKKKQSLDFCGRLCVCLIK